MNNSSDSSTDASEESVDTTTSWTTAKRIKRAMKHRRHRKSSTSSKSNSFRKKVMANENQSSIGNSIGSNTNDSCSCAVEFDELRYDADDDAHPSSEFRSRDFGLPLKLVDSAQSDKSKKRKSKKRRSQRSGKSKNRANHSAEGVAEPEEKPRPSMKGFSSAPNFAGVDGAGESDSSRRRNPFSPIPSLLSNTVFSSQSPSNSPHLGSDTSRPPIHRSNSLPAPTNRTPPVGNAVQFARGAARAPTVAPAVQDTTTRETEPEMSRTAAVVMLLVSTGLVAVCAEFLVDAIPQMIKSSSVSEAFIGLIILPIVGNAAEHVTAVSVATKNKMDLSIGVSVGSSIQIGMSRSATLFTYSSSNISQLSSSPP